MNGTRQAAPLRRGTPTMQIPVLIEPVTNNGYRVTTGQPLVLTAEGATKEDALQQMRHILQARLSTGAEIALLEISASDHPLAPYAAMFKDNPLFDDWQAAIAEYRQQRDDKQELS